MQSCGGLQTCDHEPVPFLEPQVGFFPFDTAGIAVSNAAYTLAGGPVHRPPINIFPLERQKLNIIFAVLHDQMSFELRQPEQHAQRLTMAAAA